MKVLIFHGYLLRGTGSNVYNASVATALARMGHEVHLLCQDRRAAELPWVDRLGSWERGELEIGLDELRLFGPNGTRAVVDSEDGITVEHVEYADW